MSQVVYHEHLDEDPRTSTHDLLTIFLSGLSTAGSFNPFEYVKTFDFSANAQPSHESVVNAVDALVVWTFVTRQDDVIIITNEGRFLKGLPLGYYAAAVMTSARQHNLLGQMLPLIALTELGDMRHDPRKSFGKERLHPSESVHQIATIVRELYSKGAHIPRDEKKKLAEESNISLRGFRQLVEKVQHLERILRRKADWKCYLPIPAQEERELFNSITQNVIDFADAGVAIMNRKTEEKEPEHEGTFGTLLREALTKKEVRGS